jgi:hypothetical protein
MYLRQNNSSYQDMGYDGAEFAHGGDADNDQGLMQFPASPVQARLSSGYNGDEDATAAASWEHKSYDNESGSFAPKISAPVSKNAVSEVNRQILLVYFSSRE